MTQCSDMLIAQRKNLIMVVGWHLPTVAELLGFTYTIHERFVDISGRQLLFHVNNYSNCILFIQIYQCIAIQKLCVTHESTKQVAIFIRNWSKWLSEKLAIESVHSQFKLAVIIYSCEMKTPITMCTINSWDIQIEFKVFVWVEQAIMFNMRTFCNHLIDSTCHFVLIKMNTNFMWHNSFYRLIFIMLCLTIGV